MRLAIIEPSSEGHHMSAYARNIARCAIERGWQVDLVTTREAARHAAYDVAVRACGNMLRPHVIGDGWTGSPKGMAQLLFRQCCVFEWAGRAFKEYVRQTGTPDVVYVVNLDHFDKVMSVMGSPFGNAPFAGMLMSPKFHMAESNIVGPGGGMQRVCALSFRRLVRLPALRALLTLDETLPRYLGSRSLQGHRKVRYVPDIASMSGDSVRPECRRELGLGDDETVVLVYGSLAHRKGIDILLGALADPACDSSVSVLLAGSMDAEVRALLNAPLATGLRASGRLRHRDGFLSEAQEYTLFHAADIAWLGYQGFFGSSGVLLQAGSAGLPVIACQNGLIGFLTSKYSLGPVVDVTDAAAVIAALNELASNADLRVAYGRRGASHASAHTPERFGSAICDEIAAAFGRSPRLEAAAV